jgi:hypothetical protein
MNPGSSSGNTISSHINTFSIPDLQEVKEIEVVINDLSITALSITNHNIVFQTKNDDYRISITVMSPGDVKITTGFMKGESQNEFTVTNSSGFNRWYSLQIPGYKANLKIAVVTRNDSLFQLSFANVIGPGYLKNSVFNSQIDGFSLKCQYLKTDISRKIGGVLEIICLLCIAAFLVFCFIGKINIPLKYLALAGQIIVLIESMIRGSFSYEWEVFTYLIVAELILILILSFFYLNEKDLTRKKKIVTVSFIVMAGFVFAVFYGYIIGVYYGFSYYPQSTFLFRPYDKFMDFYNGLSYAADGYGRGMVGMSAVGYFIFSFFSLVSLHNYFFAFLLYSFIFLGFLFFYNYRNMYSSLDNSAKKPEMFYLVFILSLLTYPVLIMLDRGNFEGYGFIFLSIFILLHYSGKSWLSTVFLALAVVLKIYPAIFLLIFIADRKYKQAIFTLALALIMSGFIFDGNQLSYNISQFLTFIGSATSSQNSYNQIYIFGDEGASFCSSLFGGFKGLIYMLQPSHANHLLRSLFEYYPLVSAVFGGVIGLYIVLVEKESWKKVALAVFGMILLPFITADYRLIEIYIPLWLFINSGKKSIFDGIYTLLFALLLIPKNYFLIKGEMSISVVLNPLILCIFTLLIIIDGLRNLKKDDLVNNLRGHLSALKYLFVFWKKEPDVLNHN